MTHVTPPSKEFAYPTLPITGLKVTALTDSLIAEKFDYKLGGKVSPLGLQATEFRRYGINGLDCSGFVRWVLYHALGQPSNFDIPDGSVNQHEAFDHAGFKQSTYEDAKNHDNVLRIAFLAPEHGGGIGHVLFVWNAQTSESHGGVGPGHRVWGDDHAFMHLMEVFVVSVPWV